MTGDGPHPLRLRLRLALGLLPLPAEQFPVDVGDPLQVLFQLVVVVHPATDALQQVDRYDRACGAARPEGHAQIPHWAMAFAPSAFAVWVAAGEIAFDERAAQGFGDRREQLHQALATLL